MGFRIVIAPDSFKGSLSSEEAASAIAERLTHISSDLEIMTVPMADGGEGTAEVLVRAFGGKMMEAEVSDPLGKRITARYGICSLPADDGHTEQIAIIESSSACGLTLLSRHERNPLYTTTYGVGELITDAIGKGCTHLMIGLGGSATNDGGTGMLEALGFRFLDADGNRIAGCCGETLCRIADIDDSHMSTDLKKCRFTVACDVDTSFYGEDGAARIFASQKGASLTDIEILENGMTRLACIIHDKYDIDLRMSEGSGAAGGLGGAFKACLGAELKRGIDMVMDAINFDGLIKGADLIITGEGRIDSQSKKGKVIYGILERAEKQGIPVCAIGGCIEKGMSDSRFAALMAACPTPEKESDLEYAMRPEVAYANISDAASKAAEELFPSLFREIL